MLEDSAFLPGLAHGDLEQGIDLEETVGRGVVTRPGDGGAIEADGGGGEEDGGARTDLLDGGGPAAVVGKVVGFVGDDVEPAFASEEGEGAGCGHDLLVGGDNEVGPGSADAAGGSVVGEDLTDGKYRFEKTERLFDAAVHLTAEDVRRGEVEARIGDSGVYGDIEGANANDGLAVADGDDDEFGAGTSAKCGTPALKGFSLAGTEGVACGGDSSHVLRLWEGVLVGVG